MVDYFYVCVCEAAPIKVIPEASIVSFSEDLKLPVGPGLTWLAVWCADCNLVPVYAELSSLWRDM